MMERNQALQQASSIVQNQSSMLTLQRRRSRTGIEFTQPRAVLAVPTW